MELSPRRFSPTRSKFSFLTDGIGFSDEAPDIRSRRAEYVQNALFSVTRIITRIQDDIRGLDRQLQNEVLAAFASMQLTAEYRLHDAVRKLTEAEVHLKAVEDGVETCDEVATLKREIALYTDKTAKMEKQGAVLHVQNTEYENAVRMLTKEIQETRVTMRQLHRGNLHLHKSIDASVLSIPPKVKTPRPDIYRVVPFDVFLELSSRDVGTLSLSEIQTFIKYKKHVETVKSYITVQRAKVRLTRFTLLSDRSQTSLEELFMQCVAACNAAKPVNARSMSTVRSYAIFPFPELTEFETMNSARLFSIDRTRQLAERERGKRTYLTRRQFSDMPVVDRLVLVLPREDCVERLRYFLSHSNRLRPVFDQSTLEVRTQDTKSQFMDSQQDTNRLCNVLSLPR